MENTIVICRSNKNANLYNQHIRNQILFREEELTGGDYIMVVRNNYFWLATESERAGFLANGDMAEVRRVSNEIGRTQGWSPRTKPPTVHSFPMQKKAQE